MHSRIMDGDSIIIVEIIYCSKSFANYSQYEFSHSKISSRYNVANSSSLHNTYFTIIGYTLAPYKKTF